VGVYFGSTVQAERTAADIVFTGVGAHDRAGVSVAGDFDYNGDGTLDILIGAEQVNRTPDDDPGAGCNAGAPCGNGKVYLIYFDPTDTTHYPNVNDPALADVVSLSLVGQPGGIPGVVFEGAEFGDQAGFAVAGGGRINAGTGPDLAIGAPGRDVPDSPSARTNAGTVYVVFDGQGLSGTVSLGRVANGQPDELEGIVYKGSQPGDRLGFSVAFLRGVAGGLAKAESGDQVGMGSPGSDALNTDAGAADVHDSRDSDTSTIEVDTIGLPGGVAGFRLLGTQSGEQLGWTLGPVGDTRSDGTQEIAVGAPQ
jgi:hypothetical protein